MIEQILKALMERKKEWAKEDFLLGELMDDVLGLVQEVSKEYSENIIIDYLQFVRDNANREEFDNENGWALSDLIILATEFDALKNKKEKKFSVELPCNIGDTVYIIVGKDISKQKIQEIRISNVGIEFVTNRRIFNISEFNKKVFLTWSEAENTLAK